MEIKIISNQCIKPFSPTPSQLKTYKISLLDQYGPSGYGPVLLFYSSNQEYSISKRSQILKQSLSQTLTRYYPVAGKIADNLSIDCNDQGVLYIETRVNNSSLDDYLSSINLDVSSLFKLFPDVIMKVVISGAHVGIVQENVFTCGGMALGFLAWHVIFDATSASAFLKTWSAFARHSVEEALNPNFTASTIFPPNISFSLDPVAMTSRLFESSPSVVTRRFFFDGSVVAKLKAQATNSRLQNPSRVEVVSALLLKSFTAALKEKMGTQMPTLMNFQVNLRRRATPQLPETCVGNLLLVATVLSKGEEEFDGLVWKMREGVSRINGDVVRSLQGDGGWLKLSEIITKLHDEILFDSGIVNIGLNSWCNLGLYNVDFGWGKPLWIPAWGIGIKNYIFLTDTKHGDGIEAWVSMDEQVMAVLEQDKNLLSLVSLDPSPLELGNNPNPSLPMKTISSMSKL